MPFSPTDITLGPHTGDCDGVAYCRMFNEIISGKSLPEYLSSDNGLPAESRIFSQMSPSNATVASDFDGNNKRCNQLFQ